MTKNEVTLTEPLVSTPTRSVFDVLMSHETNVPSLKLDPKTGNATICCCWLRQIQKVWCSCNHAI